MTYAKVIADSVGSDGTRLTTIEGRFHRFVLAEANTHRVISKNSASSRAIPLGKQIAKIKEDLAYPDAWPVEQRGMQGGDEIEDVRQAETWWNAAALGAIDQAQGFAALGVHKSVVNRLLEPFMWHTVVFTATAWTNFFDQRCSSLAQPEIRVFAEACLQAMEESEPRELEEGDWHLPYVDEGEIKDIGVAVKASTARCARVSYETQDGERSAAKDLLLYERLVGAEPPHWSPLEHVATPWPANRQDPGTSPWFVPLGSDKMTRPEIGHLPNVGNLLGWRSLRTEVEVQQGVTTYR